MFFEQLLINPREAVQASTEWARRAALVSIVKAPQSSDYEFFDKLIYQKDLISSLLAAIGIKKLFPSQIQASNTWKELFSESIDLLARRSCSGPTQLRIAALKALIFASDQLNHQLISRIIESLENASVFEGIYSNKNQTLPLLQAPHGFFMQEGFGLLLTALPLGEEKLALLKRELSSTEPSRIIAALISLQLMPIEELSDRTLELARHENKTIAIEAAKALFACGGSKVFLIILSLLKETKDYEIKAQLLPLAAATGREEVWPMILESSSSNNSTLARAAIKAASYYSINIEEKAGLYREAMKSADPSVACLAASFAWQNGSLKAIRILEKNLASGQWQNRLQAARTLSQINPEIAIQILTASFDEEKNSDVTREIILSVRALLSAGPLNFKTLDLLLPWFSRLLKSVDPFKRSQCAVMCGLLGKPAEHLILGTLEREEHPHVIASLLSALGKCRFDKTLIYSRFHDHPDPRVRANMLEAMPLRSKEVSVYLSNAIKDESPRVRAIACKKLFMLGQLDILGTINRMLLIPDPTSVLSGCYALSQILRIQTPTLTEAHPIVLALAHKNKIKLKALEANPIIINTPEMPALFKELTIAKGNKHKALWILEEYYRKYPSSYPVRRMLSSILAIDGQYKRALELLGLCIQENPGSLADLLDAYRISLRLCNLDKASRYGERAKLLYSTLLSACIQLCATIRGRGAEIMLKKLHHLNEPSMNLYNAMIQLKAIEKDNTTILELLGELLLARPFNSMVIKKLASMLPVGNAELRAALELYAASIPSE
jgi:HEAT repeat protein